MKSFSSHLSVLSFQFARVSPSVSGFEDFILEDEDEDLLLFNLVFHYLPTVPLYYLLFSGMCNSDMYCISIIEYFVKQLHELYI